MENAIILLPIFMIVSICTSYFYRRKLSLSGTQFIWADWTKRSIVASIIINIPFSLGVGILFLPFNFPLVFILMMVTGLLIKQGAKTSSIFIAQLLAVVIMSYGHGQFAYVISVVGNNAGGNLASGVYCFVFRFGCFIHDGVIGNDSVSGIVFGGFLVSYLVCGVLALSLNFIKFH